MTDSRKNRKTGEPRGAEGFEESPQARFEAEQAAGTSMEDWLRQAELEAEREQRDAEMSRIRSEAGRHRTRVQRKAREAAADADSQGADRASASGKERKKPATEKHTPSGRKTTEKRTGGGSIIEGTNDPRARARFLGLKKVS